MSKTYVQSVNEYNGKKVALIRSGMDSFEIIINKVTGLTEIWKAQYKKMDRGYEKEIFPKMIYKGLTSELKVKYSKPIQMIENYVLCGTI